MWNAPYIYYFNQPVWLFNPFSIFQSFPAADAEDHHLRLWLMTLWSVLREHDYHGFDSYWCLWWWVSDQSVAVSESFTNSTAILIWQKGEYENHVLASFLSFFQSVCLSFFVSFFLVCFLESSSSNSSPEFNRKEYSECKSQATLSLIYKWTNLHCFNIFTLFSS